MALLPAWACLPSGVSLLGWGWGGRVSPWDREGSHHAPDGVAHLGHDRVSEGSKAMLPAHYSPGRSRSFLLALRLSRRVGPSMHVQPSGNPISASTHAGLSGPVSVCPITSESGREFRAIVSALADPLFQSRAVGVVHALIAVNRPSPLVGERSARLWFPHTVGVGQTRFTSLARFLPCVPASCDGLGFVCRFSFGDARGVDQDRRACVVSDGFPFPFVVVPFASLASAVGHDEEALSLVRRTNVGSAYAVPPRIIPERGQVPENGSETAINESWDVFDHHAPWSKLANDARELTP